MKIKMTYRIEVTTKHGNKLYFEQTCGSEEEAIERVRAVNGIDCTYRCIEVK